MQIDRSDFIYVDIDTLESHTEQYTYLLEMLQIRYAFSYSRRPSENKEEYISYCKIKEHIKKGLISDRDMFIMECKDLFPNEKHYFIKDYAYYNNPDYQYWLSVDLSLPKEMLIAQISRLKDDFDNKQENTNLARSGFIKRKPIEFAKLIKRQFGDFLFVFDCKQLGYKNQDIKYSIYDYRKGKKTISDDTIKKYIELAFKLLEENPQ